MARKRRTYTREFKVEAVKLVTEKGYSVAEAARSLGIGQTLLRSWKLALEKQRRRRPSPVTATSRPSRRNSATSAPRTNACRWNATF